mmetsp:Transcript_12953/g.26552  ORF Transcript_12953/g.26552 Transcript_12953/m.26552 type:complete len:171 (+) Transcript_12953:306-818(+)
MSVSASVPVGSASCVYLARVPPALSVTKLRALLSPLAEPTRVYLQKEDRSASKRRARGGGGAGRRFTEGWLEFRDKKTAKKVADTLHMTNMERKGRHADDLWVLKYLRGFTWSMLTEKVAYERRVKDARLRREAAEAGREVREWKDRIEEGRKFEMMVEKKKGKRKRGEA